jgi:glycosyltransferase
MNKGVLRATGDVIGILNSDDFYDTHSVLLDIAHAFEDRNLDAVYGDITYFNTDTKKITRYWKAGQYSESKLDNGWTIPHPALFVRKSVYERYGLFRTDYKIASDYEFILRILKIHKISILYIPEVFVRMYDGGTSAHNIHQRKIGWQELKKAWTDNLLSIPKFFIIRRAFSIHLQGSRLV